MGSSDSMKWQTSKPINPGSWESSTTTLLDPSTQSQRTRNTRFSMSKDKSQSQKYSQVTMDSQVYLEIRMEDVSSSLIEEDPSIFMSLVDHLNHLLTAPQLHPRLALQSEDSSLIPSKTTYFQQVTSRVKSVYLMLANPEERNFANRQLP